MYGSIAANMTSRAKLVVELSKIRISQLVAMSTVVGYIMAAGSFALDMILPVLGTFLLSCGSAALNQYQERHLDAQMQRTRLRPIPSGRMSAAEALTSALGLLAAGSLVLAVGPHGIITLTLGLFNVMWYNGIYTPLKRYSPRAVIPGSLIGAIPPAIGWAAAGGSLLEPELLALAMFFFIWQIPHFWLLLFTYGKDYERAGFPALTSFMTNRELARSTYYWTILTVISCMMIPILAVSSSILLYLALLASAAWLLWNSRNLLTGALNDFSFRGAFMGINIYMLLVMLALSIDSLLGSGI
ncbi:MAG: protoheme IX farnesyltransferase [Calditrichia bacterium]